MEIVFQSPIFTLEMLFRKQKLFLFISLLLKICMNKSGSQFQIFPACLPTADFISPQDNKGYCLSTLIMLTN